MIYLIFTIIVLIIIYYLLFIKNENFSNTDKYYFFYISKSPLRNRCAHNINAKQIGYISDLDKLFINAITKSYRIKPYKIIKLNPIVPVFDNIDFAIVSLKKNSMLFNTISDQNLFIYTFDTIEFKRMNLFMEPKLNFENINIKEFWKFNSKLIISYTDTKDTPIIILNNTEQFITRLKRDPEIEDSSFHCYGEKNIVNKMLCNSHKNHIWDRPCINNTDCDFYNKNKQYQVGRGKCINAFCELPIGVQRLSYRKYQKYKHTDVNSPFCHGNINKECTDKYTDYIF